jgi:hypothetical protein
MSPARMDRTTSVTLYGPVTLHDLRNVMAKMAEIADQSTVSFEHYKGDQREGSSLTITVHEPLPGASGR